MQHKFKHNILFVYVTLSIRYIEEILLYEYSFLLKHSRAVFGHQLTQKLLYVGSRECNMTVERIV